MFDNFANTGFFAEVRQYKPLGGSSLEVRRHIEYLMGILWRTTKCTRKSRVFSLLQQCRFELQPVPIWEHQRLANHEGGLFEQGETAVAGHGGAHHRCNLRSICYGLPGATQHVVHQRDHPLPFGHSAPRRGGLILVEREFFFAALS